MTALGSIVRSFVGCVLGALTALSGTATLEAEAPSTVATAHLSHAQIVSLLRKHVKYVFVLYQENRSFDSYFGTFPGANGIFSHPAVETPGFRQALVDTDGSIQTITPFRIGPDQFAADTDDIDHSHSRIVAKMDVTSGSALMDKFALTEETKYSPTGNPSLMAKQFGELSMAYEDCDTVPFLWNYAHRFVLMDNIFQTMSGPSTPGNLAIIGAQTGETQQMLHPNEAYTDNGNTAPGVPVLNDNDQYWGSPKDTSAHPLPVNPADFKGTHPYGVQLNLTYATLPLTTAARNAPKVAASDEQPQTDLADVQDDLAFLGRSATAPTGWRWYEEGFDKEPTDVVSSDPLDAAGRHASYVTHHNGPQYFGYVANNPAQRANLRGLSDFYGDLQSGTLPAGGGVFFVKGGYINIMGLKPVDPDPAVAQAFLGDDDHPAYSDAQISEAAVATAVNAIANSKYWRHSAIIITWDDSEGDYDHVPPKIRSIGPDGSVTSGGPRVPLILISPYARTHFVSHELGSHASVVKFVNATFGLSPLASLPNETAARLKGEAAGLKGMGPQDDPSNDLGDLTSAFDPQRLLGRVASLPKEYVLIANATIATLPHYKNHGCMAIGIVPVDVARGVHPPIPLDFNPRPKTNPTAPLPAPSG
jgi:phospholipase C